MAIRTISRVCQQQRFEAIIWFSARDVDLQFTGPKAVRPHVLSPEDMSKYYTKLVAPKEMKDKGFNARAFFEQQLQKNDLGPCLFVFDNFETSQAPVEMYVWIDTFLRNAKDKTGQRYFNWAVCGYKGERMGEARLLDVVTNDRKPANHPPNPPAPAATDAPSTTQP